jgi:hypothetical protein
LSNGLRHDTSRWVCVSIAIRFCMSTEAFQEALVRDYWQLKLSASSMSPLPLYFATFG